MDFDTYKQVFEPSEFDKMFELHAFIKERGHQVLSFHYTATRGYLTWRVFRPFTDIPSSNGNANDTEASR